MADAAPSRGRAEVEGLLNGAKKHGIGDEGPEPATQPPPEPTEADPRPGIQCARGGRGEWTREAVKVLVDSGPKDDRRSLYGSVRIASTTGAAAGDVVTLAAAPPPEPDARLRVPEGTLLIRPVTMKGICRRLDREARWFTARRDRYGDDTFEPSNPTPDDAEHALETYKDDLLDVDPRPRLRTLRGVVDAPSLRRDGTVIDRPGWDSATWLYADFDPADWQGLQENPTRGDARAAMLKLYDLVAESSFAEPIHRAAWAALVLTLVGRPYAAGNVPLFAFTANAPGVGKGTLVDLASIIATGRPSAKWAPVSGRKADAESEERKRLMAIALAGTRCVCIDNIKAGDPLGTPALDAALTAGTDDRFGTVADRVLGETAITEAPWSCVMTATGNNLTVVGDMARRTLLCRLVTNNPDPEMRVYRHHPKVADYCIAHRDELLTAALTVLVAHRDAVARRETKPLPRIGSFGGWSDRIRSAVTWADPDGCDPWASNAEVKAGAQPEQAETLTFLGAWHSTFGTREVMVKDVDLFCRDGSPDYDAEMAEAVGNLSLSPPRGKAAVNTQHLGRWLAAHKDRPGAFVLREGRRYSGKPTRWYVEKIDAPAPEPAAPGEVRSDSLNLTDGERRLIEQVRNWDGNPDTAPPGLGLMGVFEYDPPLAMCPDGCKAPFRHLDAPEDSPEVIAWRERYPKWSTMSAAEGSAAVGEWREQRPADSLEVIAWREAGYPGRRECLGCNTIFEATPLPPGGRRLANWRPETPAEVEARLIEAAKRRAARQTPNMFEESSPADRDSHPESTKAAEQFDGLF